MTEEQIVANARVDAGGVLVSADEPLLELNARAGGRIGAPLAMPHIAALVRLARRLRITVSRRALARDGDEDVELWVRAQPRDEDVALTVTGWARRPARSVDTPADHGREDAFARSGSDWRWETDEALRITALSPAVAGAIGSDADMLIGEPLTRLFGFEEDADGGLPVLAALAEHRRFDAQHAKLRGGDETRYRLSAVPMIDGRGSFAGFHGNAVRVGAGTAGSVSLAPDPAAPAEEGAFASRLDAALRAPLGRIIANADDLHAQNEGPLRSEYAGYATDIASAGRHLLSLVDDLVDLHAIERPDYRPERDELDLADLARRAAGLLAVRASRGEVGIDRLADAESLPATGEFRRVLQILVNLLGNAIRYSPPGGTVRVTAKRQGEFAAIIVADDGKGIAPADQRRIFDKFERIDPSEPGGTGLGLYIARRLARAMGGDIVVDSAAGQGARFTLTLPLR